MNTNEHKKAASKKSYLSNIRKLLNTTIQIPMFLLCVGFAAILSVIITSYNAADLTDNISIYKRGVNSYIESNSAIINTISGGLNSGKIKKDSSLSTYLEGVISANSSVMDAYIIYDNSKYITSSESTENSYLTGTDWFIAARNNPAGVYISSPITDSATNDTYIIFAKAILKDNQLCGVVAINVSTESLTTSLNTQNDNTIIAYLNTNDGSYINKSNDDFSFSITETSGLPNGWSITVIKNTTSSMIILISVILFLAFVFFVFVMICNFYCTKKIGNLFTPFEATRDNIESFAKGDLSIDFDNSKSSNEPATEIKELNKSLNLVVQSFKKNIDITADMIISISENGFEIDEEFDINSSFLPIKDALIDLCNSIKRYDNEILGYVENITAKQSLLIKNSEKIAYTSVEEKDAIEVLTNTLITLNDQQDALSRDLGNVKDRYISVSENLISSKENIPEIINVMNNIDECYMQIQQFSSEINEIVNQISLLALHASIEAARSNANGSSFESAVIEIKTLAAKAIESSNQIEFLVSSSNAEVLKEKDILESTIDTLKSNINYCDNSNEMAESLTTSIEAHIDTIDTLNQNARRLSLISLANEKNSKKNDNICDELSKEIEQLKNISI